MLDVNQKIHAIDTALEHVLNGPKEGVEISEYEIDGLRVKKRNPIELIKELQKLKGALVAKTRPRYLRYVF
ncbi:hypothetical protein NHP190012_09970 [Helicobacter sp. NHP19-012]|uniref:Uncharacterized protein n=1 Tax=Helicobacter gastrofelis TaxID=2849642 RepID=A0ABN6I740_9HELI|nr:MULTISPECIES: hypothetical protein [unclassified Helicobacter]BCZ19355.1 hypothetical protein NHP190012_09970 [Helicobacter sp. NHP19-012]GMB96828.1 hypothetical protein NHP22001_14170 [Helicobacter sp. NHP22-001]